MRIYMCRWENGDISFVSAMSKDGAIWALDEVGAATAGMLYAVNQFMVHLTLDDHGELELESLGEDTEHFIREVGYPILNKVEAGMTSVDAEETDEAQKLIAEAVVKERMRLWPENDGGGVRSEIMRMRYRK